MCKSISFILNFVQLALKLIWDMSYEIFAWKYHYGLPYFLYLAHLLFSPCFWPTFLDFQNQVLNSHLQIPDKWAKINVLFIKIKVSSWGIENN